MGHNIHFSLLIANYNNGHYFGDCYASIINQTNTSWEVIIIDDASTDNSVSLISELIATDKRFKLYVNNENEGCGYTKRRCVALANSNLCAFLDPDDALLPTAIDAMIEVHKKDEKVSLVYSNLYFCNSQLSVLQAYQSHYNLQVPYLESTYSITHFASFKRDLYSQTLGIDPELKRAVDQDLYLKCEEVGQICHINEILYKYRVHEGGISTNQNVGKAFAWHMYVIIKACKRRGVDFEDILANFFLSRGLKL